MQGSTYLVALAFMPCLTLSADPTKNLIPTYGPDLVPSYSDLSPASAAPVMSGIDMLRMAVPGNPGEDYPIYAQVPETAFSCDGRVEGGYYADPEAECQPFHVCSADRDGGLAKNSFLCPNGTLFNQENFVCEYWFNVDCSQAESFYGLNENIGTVEQRDGLAGAASSPTGGYASPPGASSPSGGYASPPDASSPPGASSLSVYASPPGASSPSSDTSFASVGYDSQSSSAGRPGRREGRVIEGSRTNNARKNEQRTNTRNFNNRFANFPANIGKSSTDTKLEKSEKQSGKKPDDQLNARNSKRQQKKFASNEKLTERRSNLQSRDGNRKNRNRASLSRSRTQDVKKSERIRKEFNRAGRTQNQKFKESRGNVRNGKSSNSRQPQIDKRLRAGRQKVSTGYLPPKESQAPGDSILAASGPDYDYEESALPTYAGASDTAGQSNYVAPVADTGYAAGSADTAYEAPADNGEGVDALADEVYEEDTLPTYNRGVYNNGKLDSGSSYTAPVADSVYGSPLADSDYDEDILPAYNNGVYNNAGSDSATGGTSYTAPSAESYGAPADSATGDGYGSPSGTPSDSYGSPLADSDYEEDILPQYNNGVYNNAGFDSSATSGTSYTAPNSDSYGAPSSPSSDSSGLADSEYEEDILPQYNNGVYNNGGLVSTTADDSYGAPSAGSYGAPSADSYGVPSADGAPSQSAELSSGNPSDSYASRVRGSPFSKSIPISGKYKDPKADILPEYFKSEITLGLNDIDDVPRVDPFLSDYGSSAADSYSVAGSSPIAAVATPDLTYGVPAAPTISLADYNIQEVSDKGFKGVGSASYGR